MLTMLKDFKGTVEINGKPYKSITDAISSFRASDSSVCIRLLSKSDNAIEHDSNVNNDIPLVHKITVKAYMTRKATVDFDFMLKMNNDEPMPLRTMIGTIEKETPGMYYMKLHGDITSERTKYCLKCGRPITNPVSQYFGMGPECGGHNYVNPFYSKEELQAAVNEYRKKLVNIKWEGWVIKSAITSDEILED